MEHCPKCGAELADDGLCAMCLLAGGFNTAAMTVAEPHAEADPQHALEYDCFGHYQILRVIGEGGMGTVYLAQQTDPIRRLVALKVVRPGMDTRQILSRFNYERQALALMDHPNIARVYDASATEKGRPYFVMEYIEGVAITTYCDQHRLNTQQRLELFVPVCQALQHAHQKGVIHRDIKPSNILVMEQDGRAVPKVIDFGIARATDQRAVENTMLTQFGQFVGTPEYISPEQADVVTNDVDTSSDVYSLGILLYELLVGAVPFDGASLRKAGLAELLRIIREEEVPPMPSKLTGMGQTATDVAARRSTDPVSLKRQLTGDLNWIVMKAVEKSRQRRYPAVAELAADIRRHLEDQTVLASPPSAMYRARKFVRRHRLSVLAAAAVMLAMVAGLGATAWEASVARRERGIALGQRSEAVAQKAMAEARTREAAAERARAEEQAANATRQEQAAEHQRTLAETRLSDVTSMANSMLFDLNDQVKDLPGSTKARETITHLGLEYLNKLSPEAQGNSPLQRQLGAAYLKFGELQGSPGRASLWDLKGARESYARSVAILEPQVRANPHNPALRHLLAMAYLGSAHVQETAADRKAGYDHAKLAAEKLLQELPSDLQAQGVLADALVGRAESAADENCDCGRAQPEEVRLALDIRERMLASGPKTAEAQWQLARTQVAMGGALVFGDDVKSLDWLTKGLAGLQALSREDPANAQYQRDRAQALSDTGYVLILLGRFDEGVERARQAVALQEQVAAFDPRNAAFWLDLSNYQWNLAFTLRVKGDSAGMLENLNKALAIQEEQSAAQPRNSDLRMGVAKIRGRISGLLNERGDKKAAQANLRAAESIYRKLVQEHPGQKTFIRGLAKQLVDVGLAMADGGDRSGAIALYREGLALYEPLCAGKGATEEDCAGLAGAHAALSRGYDALGRKEEAIAEDRAAIVLYERVVSRDPKARDRQRAMSGTYTHLSTLYDSRSDWKSAVEMSLKALPFLEADYNAQPGDLERARRLDDALYYLRNQYPKLGEYDRAIEAARRLVEIAEKSASLDPQDLVRGLYVTRAYMNLGWTYRQSGRRAESLAAYRHGVITVNRTPIESMPAFGRRLLAEQYLYLIEQGFRFWDEQEEALPLCRRVVPVLEAVLQGDPNNQQFRMTLDMAYRSLGALEGDFRNFPALIDNYEKAMKLDVTATRSPTAPADVGANQRWLQVGQIKIRIAGALAAARKPDAATQALRDALESFQRGRRMAETAQASGNRNFAAMRDLVGADRWSAFTLERLGERKEALEYARQALSLAVTLAASDQGTRSNQDALDDARGVAVRLAWLTSGPAADFRSILGGEGTPRRVQSDLARGWRVHAANSLQVEDLSVEAALKAVEIDRALLQQDAQPAVRLSLALDLEALGKAYRFVARRSDPSEIQANYLKGRQAFSESHDLLAALKQAGALPESNAAELVTVAENIETVQAKLSALANASAIQSQPR
jgi:serine/threonine protein kinase/tetratricopeptide (TPR) repeat protein